MKILLLNQTFYPDVVATSQYLGELASALAEQGHSVTVITGRRAYDNPGKLFSKYEEWRGIKIIRLGSAGLGKDAKWKRALDFASFMILCFLRMLFLPKQDVVVTLTSPPLISFLGALLCRFSGSRLVYWVMDFNPDEAIAAGWLRAGSLAAKVLEAISRFTLRQATGIVALDHFMGDRIAAKGINRNKIYVIPPWSQDSDVQFDPANRELFRKQHGMESHFVVMYSGNHSPCHPLDTVLQGALKMAAERDIKFLFVGGGSQFPKVKDFARQNSMANVLCLPYQPLNQLAGALSSADAHLVVMGDPFVGLVHPCKVYNILKVGAPLIYVGPTPSHVTEIVQEAGDEIDSASVGHGEVDSLVENILRLKKAQKPRGNGDLPHCIDRFSKAALLPQLVAVIEKP